MPSKVLLKYGGTYIHTSKNYLLRKTYRIHQKCSSKGGRDREKWLAKSGPPPRKKRTDAMPTKVILKYGATYIHAVAREKWLATYNIHTTYTGALAIMLSIRIHQNPPESTRIHQNPSESTRIHQNPPESHQNPPESGV